MELIWVFDIDFTVIDSGHRDHLFDTDPQKCFSAEEMDKDVPMAWVPDSDLWRHGQFRYGAHWYLTARHEGTRWSTTRTLQRHQLFDVWQKTSILMKDLPRHVCPAESAPHFKTRVLLELARMHYTWEFVLVEDHPKTIALVRALEHPRLHVLPSNDTTVLAASIHDFAAHRGIAAKW